MAKQVVFKSGLAVAGFPRITVWPAEFEPLFLAARAHGASFSEALSYALSRVQPLQVMDRPNQVTTAGRNLLRDLLRVTNRASNGLQYLALGTGNTAPAPGDTQLVAEVYRDALADEEATDGQLIIHYYLTTSQANGHTLREAGLFGRDATAAANSGTLYARGVHSEIVKDDSKAVTYQWTLPFTAV